MPSEFDAVSAKRPGDKEARSLPSKSQPPRFAGRWLFIAILIATALQVAPVGDWPLPIGPVEAVGDLTINSAVHLSGSTFSVQGTWQPRGNQCWGPGNDFHYLIEIYDDPDGQLPVSGTLLATIDPAPCNGDYTHPVDSADRGTGGAWPASGQGGNRFRLGPGAHNVCGVLRHVSATGQDIAAATCYSRSIGVFVVEKDFVPDSNASVTVSLDCSDGSISPSSESASESSGATFGVVNFSGDPTCTATEAPIPQGYTSTGTCSASISDARCTIVNNEAPATATPVNPDAPTGNSDPDTPVGVLPTPTSGSPSETTGNPPPAGPVQTPGADSPPRIQPPSTGSGGLVSANAD